MITAEKLERLVLERLNAERQPVDTGLRPGFWIGAQDVIVFCFKRDFCAGCNAKRIVHLVQ